jgi:hypothetical protein
MSVDIDGPDIIHEQKQLFSFAQEGHAETAIKLDSRSCDESRSGSVDLEERSQDAPNERDDISMNSQSRPNMNGSSQDIVQRIYEKAMMRKRRGELILQELNESMPIPENNNLDCLLVPSFRLDESCSFEKSLETANPSNLSSDNVQNEAQQDDRSRPLLTVDQRHISVGSENIPRHFPTTYEDAAIKVREQYIFEPQSNKIKSS